MKKVLVVEDEPAYIKVLRDQLVTGGYEVNEANDGSVGLELALKEKPDLILLDIKMPVMSGLSMLKKLRQDEWGSNANVIMLTNLGDSINISDALDSKASKYFVKSDTTLGNVMEEVKMLLE